MSLGGAAILAGLLSIFGGQPTTAQLSDLSVDVVDGRLEVSFRLREAIDEELIERIETGLPSGFRYQFKLVRPTRNWFDNTLITSQLEAVAMYNAVTREYQVNYKLDGKLTTSRVLTDRQELEAALTQFDRFTPFPIEEIKARKPIHLRVRAELGRRNLLLLIPTTIHTDWIESERFVLGAATGDQE